MPKTTLAVPTYLSHHPRNRRLAAGRHGHRIALCILAGLVGHGWALAEDTTPLNASWRLTDETWKLPGGEAMGMLGGNVLLQVRPGLKLGVGSYGAVRGERGGFITLGLAAEGHWPLSADWSAEAGGFVGGGGGRGGATLAGGGLMLRSHVGLSYSLQSWGHPGGRLSLGVSQVDFPSGVIRSRQPYLAYEHEFKSAVYSGWSRPRSSNSAAEAASTSTRAQSFALTARHYRIPGGVRQDNGGIQHPTMDLLGAQWTSRINENSELRIQADGAMGGRSTGYMQILLGLGHRWQITPGSAAKLQVAAGPAGGGAVDTGGGLLLEAGVALEHALNRQLALEWGLSRLQAPSRSFKASSLDIRLVHHFGIPDSTRPLRPAQLQAFEHRPLRARLLQQRYQGSTPDWRNRPEQAVDNLGIALDHFLSGPGSDRSVFLTGQGLAAYGGQAGAYMTGLFGAGLQQSLGGRWFAEAEGLVGAAGGGGLATGSGLVVQTNASAGYRLSPSLSVLLSAGRMAAPNGAFKAKVVGLGLAWQFTGLTQH
jgi:hypothetical protein